MVRIPLPRLVKLPRPMRISVFQISPMILISKEIPIFLEKNQQIMTDCNTSKLFIPCISHFRAAYQKARRSIKKRNETKMSRNLQGLQDNIDVSIEDPLEDTKPAFKLTEDQTMLDEFIDSDSETPDVGQYWEISNG